MKILGFVVCLAAALLAVCHGCSTGKEFITTFLHNYNSHYSNVYLILTAQGHKAKVKIQVASRHQVVTLNAGESKWVTPPYVPLVHHINENSAIRISSSAEISVVAFNRKSYTGDGTVVSPKEQLGNDYFVYTPEHSGTKQVAIVNGDSLNKITIIAKKVSTFILQPYATLSLKGTQTFSGTRIQSQHPVAVLAGHSCLSLGAKCEHVYEQLPPVSSLGKEYVVPTTTSCKSKNWAIIVAAEDNTEVTLYKGRHIFKHKIWKAGNLKVETLPRKMPMIVKSNKKVMVLLISDNRPHDPFLLTVTPMYRLATDWMAHTEKGRQSTVAIISERQGVGSVKVCQQQRCTKPKWNTLNTELVWSNVAVGTKQSHITVEGDARMAVYVYGGSHRHGYGFAGICSEGVPPPTPPPDPCEKLTCREKERCVNGACVHVSTATCHALGDPHYLTFDGQHYDFQGTCTYTMATVSSQGSKLVPFTVTTKNNHRGNRRVSFVRTVTITAHKQTIIIDRHRGRVQVNDELHYLPVNLLDGKISVRQSGYYAVLTTDFGLTVKYDWNTRLYITVTSSYYKELGGLCGNYNGDRRDDLPGGSKLSSVLQMIKKWKVKDSDLFCNDNCAGRCPFCSPKQQEHFRSFTRCGILTDPAGPFSSCHKTVEPSIYLDNCVYDVCINKGAKQILCDNLKSYYDSCLAEGVKVNPKWRMISKCFPNCPAGTHYEACASACPASCMSLDSEAQCRDPCVEGCQCNKGLVLSGDRCVPKSSCGCNYQGRYYPAASIFWGDNTCTSKCQCLSGKVKCTPFACKKSEHCVLKRGVKDCYPLSYSTCQGSGDPHYRSFDNRWFDFQGTCTYVFSQYKGSQQGLVPFQVLVQNENRGRNKAVAYTKSVSLNVFGNFTVSLSRASPGRVLVNTRSVNLPYSTEDGRLSVFRRGYFGVVTTHFGLTLSFNWNSHVSLTLPSSYSSETTGLCGNYNGKSGDDFLKADGSLAAHVNVFGHSWKAGGNIGCTSECSGGKCPECEPALLLRYQQKRYCGIIADKDGPFSQCHNKLDHTTFLKDCVFDLCMYQGHTSALCNSISTFSTSCQEAGAKVGNWRTKNFCPVSCGANSHYELCAAPCQMTCNGLAPPEGCDDSAPCTEGCVCDDGFVLSDNKCVPLAECGCQYTGQYYQNGEVFYPGESCNIRCVCSDGEVQCNTKFSCSPTEKCVVKDGSASCSPRSHVSCTVSGVRTVRTFDSQSYPLWGDCTFTLSEVEENEGETTAFSVLVQQQTSKNDHVFRNVVLQVYDMEITMETGVVSEVKVDDVRVSLPASLADGKVQVHQNGINIVIVTDFDMKLSYDTTAGVYLQIPSTYQKSPRGLCGNYNGEKLDDLVKSKAEKTAAAWVVQMQNTSCEVGCGDRTCTKTGPQKKPEAEKACDIIKDNEGPFVGCHKVVSPQQDYDACVREMSDGKGGNDVLCRHIQSYVTACQVAGAKISEWRKDDFCPITCPAGSHYELCSTSCSTTCFSLEQSEPCPLCQEGCQCDDGLMSDGDRCVPVEKCGCVVDGQYYKSGTTVLREDCSESCSCVSGQFSCSATSCKKEEECRNKDGTIGCYPTDPCAEAGCRPKENCVVSNGQAKCVPTSKATCWAFGDPHYNTFDGLSYSFQGTCTYVLVNTTGGDSSLPEVTVTSKNELRGNSEGSFVRSFTVEMLDHTIIIPSGERGTIFVDGIREELPVILEEKSISITQNGIRGILESNIGVEIAFDWSTLIMVTLSSSYYGNVNGLCGNYNDNKEDELIGAGGNMAANVTVWAETWSIPDGDPFCYHHCVGVCPQCSREDRIRYTGPEYCGILSDKKGPFAQCHAKIPVAEFVSDCLYDVCINDGRQEVLCEALSSYLTECQEAKVSTSQWRELAKCPIDCPENSHYELCGTACPRTCGSQTPICTKECVEGCICDTGYVRSGKECVKEESCGCNYNGHYHLPGTEFWADSDCKEKCVCDKATHKVRCEQIKCKSQETCMLINGVQDCYPVSFKTCSARGDPHFTTFDGLKFDFQGNCVYKLAGVCGAAKGLNKFQVNLENNNRHGNNRVAYAKVVEVEVYGLTLTLTVDNPGSVLVGGTKHSIPVSFNGSLVHVYRRHRLAVIETHFLKVSFDFVSSVRVELSSVYYNATCGLCGNYNNNPNDDLMLSNGKLTSNVNEFGVSHWVANVPGCSFDCKDCAHPLPPGFKLPGYTSACDVIKQRDGPLGDCVGRLDAEEYHSDCVYDMVISKGKQETACEIISDYVEECQRKGGIVKPWRTQTFCRMPCGKNSVYSVSATGCPISCDSLSPPTPCKIQPSEGCVCRSGFVLNQAFEDRCVPLNQCGCKVKGTYMKSGQSFYLDSHCSKLCSCSKGKLQCRNKPCHHGHHCQLKDGGWNCVKKQVTIVIKPWWMLFG